MSPGCGKFDYIKLSVGCGVSGGSRIFERWFPLVVDHRRRGVGAQPPDAEEVLILKVYNLLKVNTYLSPELGTLVSVVS